MFDDDVWLTGPGPEVATTSKIPQEGSNHQSDSSDHHTDGTGVKTKRIIWNWVLWGWSEGL